MADNMKRNSRKTLSGSGRWRLQPSTYFLRNYMGLALVLDTQGRGESME
jgi:hypothetical protein